MNPKRNFEASTAKRSRALQRCVDVGLAAMFVTLMTTATVEEVAHEWIGITTFALFVVHQALNRRWWKNLLRGKYTLLRSVETIVNVGLLLCILGQMTSSLILSEHAFGWLPAFPGAAWARIMHLVCSYWGFMLAAVHTGLHVHTFVHRRNHRDVVRANGKDTVANQNVRSTHNFSESEQNEHRVPVVPIVVSALFVAAGTWSFVQLDMETYLLLQSQFLFVDYTVPLPLTALRYLLVAAGIACLAHGFAYICRARTRAKHTAHLSIPRGTSKQMHYPQSEE